MTSTVKFQTSRVNDYMYDPSFIVPTEKDHNKHAFKATMATAQVEIAPVYANMFSELAHCPRKSLVMKVPPRSRAAFVPLEQRDTAATLYSSLHRPADVAGVDRVKYFQMPTITISPELLHTVIFDKHRYRVGGTPKPQSKDPKNKSVQTMYRESSAQTTHWKTPHYKIMDDSDPEILKLNFLEENLPPGMHEVEMILRARRRRAWEQLLPDVEDAATLEQRRLILQAIELDQWAFREEEIAAIQALRLELLERMLQELLLATADRTEGKLQRVKDRLMREHTRRRDKMRHEGAREIRRLYRENFGVVTKYKQVNIIDEHADYKSEMYAPLMRHGAHPRRGHESIQLQHRAAAMYDVEAVSTLPRWLYNARLVDPTEVKLPGRRLCIRETRWTEPVLKQLHHELLNLNETTRIKCTLRERRTKPQVLQDTKYIPHDDEDDIADEEKEAVLILQCIIRGRAAQTLIYEGRDRCRELIEELQSTHFLDLSQYTEMRRKRMEVLGQQRNKQVQWEREAHLEAALKQLQGHVLGTMLDFLSKELVRVRDERKAHALALLYERERRDREAAEAGRRQAEERRRKEHDEMFKQVVKVHQDTVDLYLQDIVTEGIEDASESNAQKYVNSLAAQVEQKAKHPPQVFVEKEELIADMVCHFLLPEVEKKRVRERVKERQKKYLRCAHELIFNKIEKLPKHKYVETDGCLDQNDSQSTKADLEAYLENIADEATPHFEQDCEPNPDKPELNCAEISINLDSSDGSQTY